MTQQNLPELPAPFCRLQIDEYGKYVEAIGEVGMSVFDADQMHAYALAALSSQGAGEAVLYVSQGQLDGLLAGTLPGCKNLDSESGVYLPVRTVAGGNFTVPLYEHTQAAQPARVVDAQLLSFLACEIECNTYETIVLPAIERWLSTPPAAPAYLVPGQRLSDGTYEAVPAPTLGSITSMQHPMNPGGFQDCGFKPAGHDYPAAPTPSQQAPRGRLVSSGPNAGRAYPPESPQAGAVTEPESMRKALSFYADPTRYHGPNQRLDEPDEWSDNAGLAAYRLDVTRDQGVIARAALAAFEAKKAGGDK